MREVNRAGIELIKSFEGLSLKPYLCPANIPTIGYGTTRYPNGSRVTLSDKPINEKQAEAYLIHEVRKIAQTVEKLVKVPVNDNEFAALVCFAYNVGTEAFKKSTLLKLLNASADRVAVADQFLRWNKAGGKELAGLTRRRQAERSLFLQPVQASRNSGMLPPEPSKEDIDSQLKAIEEEVLGRT